MWYVCSNEQRPVKFISKYSKLWKGNLWKIRDYYENVWGIETGKGESHCPSYWQLSLNLLPKKIMRHMTGLVFSELDHRYIEVSPFSHEMANNRYPRKRIKIETIYNNIFSRILCQSSAICGSGIPLCSVALSGFLSHHGIWFPLGCLQAFSVHTVLQQGVPHLKYWFCQEPYMLRGKEQTKIPCMDW